MKKYTYKIYHEYQIGDQSVTFRSAIEPEMMKDLLAALQFLYEYHIDDHDTLGEKSSTEVIHQLYSPVEYFDKPQEPYFVINTYENREQRCGKYSDKIMKEFDCEGLIDLMKFEDEKEKTRILSVLAKYGDNEIDKNTVI